MGEAERTAMTLKLGLASASVRGSVMGAGAAAARRGRARAKKDFIILSSKVRWNIGMI
jgi:hypothetical protein